MSQKIICAGLMAGSLIAIASSHQVKSPITSKPKPVNKTDISCKTPEFVLRVPGKTISWNSYISALEQPNMDQIVQSGGNTPGFSVLQNMLYETAIIQIAQARNIKVTSEEILKELDKMKKNQPHLEEILKSPNISKKQIENEIAVKLYEYKYITYGVVVTEKEIENFYKDTKNYTTPIKYKMRLILLPDERNKEEIDKKLKEGTKFEDVAKEFSSHSSKNEGGLMPLASKDQFPPVLQTEIEKTKVGEVSNWAKLGNSTFKIKLEEIIPESKQPLDTKLKHEIREKLLIEEGSAKNKLGEAVINYLSEKKIECLYNKYTSTFNDFLKRVKERAKAQKESAKKTTEQKLKNKKLKTTNNPTEKKETTQKTIEKTPETTENKSTSQKPIETTPETTENKSTSQKPIETFSENTKNKEDIKVPVEPAKQ